MTGFAICKFLEEFGWKRVGIMVETQTDIIWLLTRNGLHYALDRCNVNVAHSVLFTRPHVQQTLEETAKHSRSKLPYTNMLITFEHNLIFH